MSDRRGRRWRRAVFGVGVLLAAAASGLMGLVALQGASPDAVAAAIPGAGARVDARGIPTVAAASWTEVFRAQGFVTAGQRLWQMDLVRRKAGGRLAELFGAAAFDHDARNQAEGRLGVARAAAAGLPPDERAACDAYADGVNRFIDAYPWRWGAEYLLLRTRPEPWRCADSILVLMEMAEFLTATADAEAEQEAWRRNLSAAWQAFLFPRDHAWNRPLFGEATGLGPTVPGPGEHLAARPLGSDGEPTGEPGGGSSQGAVTADTPAYGSNNWAWSGPSAAYLANDPHLGYGVPALWYAARLRVAADDWVVGATLPGLPGVILGMTPHLAWAFTNTGEDVDDLLEEELSPDGTRYVERVEGGEPDGGGTKIWAPVETVTHQVRVRGEAVSRPVVERRTARGPLGRATRVGSGWYARQWLAFRPEVLRLPLQRFATSRSLEDARDAIAAMRIPAQNVLVMDAAGDVMYRASGTGIVRRAGPSARPRPAVDGRWDGLAPAAERPTRFWRRGELGADAVFHVETANQRIWRDELDHQWYSDDRVERIARGLDRLTAATAADMTALQRDTEGRFRRTFVRWIAERAAPADGPAADLARRWLAWDGGGRSDPIAHAAADRAEELLGDALLARLRAAFPAGDRDARYRGWNKRAWLLELIAPSHAYAFDPFAAFGLESTAVARWLVGRVASERLVPHHEANRWQAQHPFVGRVPVVGALFRVDEHPQWGDDDLVLAESPHFGPSMRLVWALRRPTESTWAFPVGQSGHVASRHYRDFQAGWAAGEAWPVFDDGLEWRFPGRAGN